MLSNKSDADLVFSDQDKYHDKYPSQFERENLGLIGDKMSPKNVFQHVHGVIPVKHAYQNFRKVDELVSKDSDGITKLNFEIQGPQ